MVSGERPSAGAVASTPMLLGLGAAAGPVYVLVGLAQVLTREGFDWTRHALSLLSNGRFGWIQVANFLLSGALVIAGAVGLRRALRPGRGRLMAPLLIAIYGAGLIGAGVFVADPALGFPPGTPAGPPAAITTHGLLHFVCGGIGFFGLIGGCFVLAARFSAEKRTAWMVFSAATGVLFFLSFAAIASGSSARAVTVAFYAAVALAWIWLTAIFRDRRASSVSG